MAENIDNNGGWTKTVVSNGNVYEAVNAKTFTDFGYPVPLDNQGRPLHTHTVIDEGSQQKYHRDWYGNETRK